MQLSTDVEVLANSLAATSELIIRTVANEMQKKRSVLEPIFARGILSILTDFVNDEKAAVD